MFNRKVTRLSAQVEALLEEKIKLEGELKQIKHEHKMADEDIKHMVKIKESQLDIEHEKKVIELEREQQKAIAEVKDDYRNKMEKRLETEVQNIKQMYSEILDRLPNINVKMKGEV